MHIFNEHKQRYMRISTKIRTSLLIIGSIAFSSASFAQDEVGELLKAAPADATALTKAYLEPVFKGFGIGLNSGWTNTGSVKKLGRFELRISATGAFVPSSDKSFDVNKIGLTRIKPTDPNNVIAPTAAGAKKSGPEVEIIGDNGEQATKFNLPRGLNVPLIPGPQLQASIGLIKGIELTARYMPEIKPGGDFGTLSMLGGGIKFQPLRFVSKTASKLLPFDLAVGLGYNQFKYSYDLDVKPDNNWVPNPLAPSAVAASTNSNTWKGQKIDATFSGINAEVIASKKLLFFTPFASLGYMTSNTDAGVRGNFAVVTGKTGTKAHYEIVANPVNIDEKYIDSFRASAGFQLNLAFLRFYASYNLAAYNYVNAGIGFGIGK